MRFQTMKRGLAVLLIQFAALATLVATTQAADVVGSYTCRGKNPTGGQYVGIVSVTKQGDVYTVGWKIGTESQEGVGLLEGDVLSVAWTGGPAVGIAVYKIQKGGTLAGRWSQKGVKGVHTETWTRRR